jgi:integrase
MKTPTINKQLSRVGAMFNWAVGEGYILGNPIKGKSLRDNSRIDDARNPFSLADLVKIFTPLKKYLHSYYYWIPYLGLYTGARLNELCQLHLSDIRQDEDGIWVFDINRNTPDKRLKSNASKRLIPLHPRLIELGFLDHVKTVKGDRFFPELSLGRDGYGKNASRWFNQRIRKLGITDRKKVFHSFRHNVANCLKQNGVDYRIADAITGHTDQSMVYGVYGKPYNPKFLFEVIKQLNFNV